MRILLTDEFHCFFNMQGLRIFRGRIAGTVMVAGYCYSFKMVLLN